LHSGACVCALVNKVPRAAMESRFGVLAWGCPPRQPIQSFRSSMAIMRMLGSSAARSVLVETSRMRSRKVFMEGDGRFLTEEEADFAQPKAEGEPVCVPNPKPCHNFLKQ